MDTEIQLATTVIAAAASQRIDIRSGWAVRVAPRTQGVHVKLGDVTVVATTSDEYVAADLDRVFTRQPSVDTHVAVIQAAATAVGTVTVIG